MIYKKPVTRCPRCRHMIQDHSTDFARTYGACAEYRRDGSPCDCDRIPTDRELDEAAFDVDTRY